MAQTLTQIGKYRVERELGRGAMGVVYKAFDPVVERMIAIKTIRLDVEDAEQLLHRLRREAKSVGQLEHPNIVTLYDAGESAGVFYLAMQFIHGETLQTRLDRQRWFTLKETQDIFRQISAGLDYAHQRNVVHRDIKPANIMIAEDGVVKLTDFGIAKLVGAGTTATGLVVGTPSYMSPEQALGKPLDGRSDIFSMGCILYEMITGEKAFQGQNVTTVMYKIVHEAPTPLTALQPGLDPVVEAIVLRALAKRPEDRFQTCAEFATALEIYLSKAAAAMPKTRAVEYPLPQTPPPVQNAPMTSSPSGAAFPPAPLATPQVPPAAATGTTLPPGPVSQTSQTGQTGQTAYGQTGVPLAWLGGGALGTLLIVVIILLVIEMRRPAPNTGGPSQPAVSNSETAVPANKAGGTTSPPAQNPSGQLASKPAAEPGSKPPAEQPGGQVQRPAQLEHEGRPLRNAAHAIINTVRGIGGAPDTYDSLVVQGDLAYQGGQYSKALDAYSKAYRMKPTSAEVRRKIATTLTLLGRADEAQQYK